MTATPIPTQARKYDLSFARWVYQNIEGADRLSLCMQCGMCSGSCPIGPEMDNGPRKLFVIAVRTSMKEEVLSSSTIWNCTQCYNCVVRCPRKVPVTYILQGLATVAAPRGLRSGKAHSQVLPLVLALRALVRQDRRAHGDYALFLLLRHQGGHPPRAREPAHRKEHGQGRADGHRLAASHEGRRELARHSGQGRGNRSARKGKPMSKIRFTYYPGCSSQGAGIHLDRSLHAISRKLDFELQTIKDWNCCGASVGHVKGGKLPSLALSGRNLALARLPKPRRCGDALRRLLPQHALGQRAHQERAEGTRAGRRRAGRRRPHLQGRPQGAPHLRGARQRGGHRQHQGAGDQSAVRPEGRGLGSAADRAAIRRHGKRRAVTTYDQPKFLDEFTEACGAEAVPFDKARTSCCGGSVAIYSPEKTLHLMRHVLKEAQDAGAE